MGRRVCVTISLPPEYIRVLKAVARERHGGNVSLAVREMMLKNRVTKSRLPLPEEATDAP